MLIKKRGYFFVLDAVLGLAVLVIGVFLITSSYVNVPQPTQVKILSDDLLNFLFITKIEDLNSAYAGVGGELWNQGYITDTSSTLLQNIGYFYETDNVYIAENFVKNVSSGVVPEQFLYEVWLDGFIIYPRGASNEHNQSKNNTDLLLTSKRFTFGILNASTSAVWGPYVAEVFVWKR